MIDGLEMLCPWCSEWLPVVPEFWDMVRWYRCNACTAERSRLYQAMRRLDPEYRLHEVEKTRRYRNEIKRAYPDLIPAYDRERRAKKRAWLRLYRSAA